MDPAIYSKGMTYTMSKGTLDIPLQFGYIRLYQIGENIMEQGGEIIEHDNICNEISYISSGEATIYVDGEKLNVKQGDIHICSKGYNHRIVVKGNERLRYTYFGFDIITTKEDSEELKELESFYSKTKSVVFKDNGVIFTFLNHFVNELYSESNFSDEIYGSYAKIVLINTYRIAKATSEYLISPKLSDSEIPSGTVFNIVKYIDANAVSITKVSEIARNLNYSASYISRIFTENMGMTIREYISRKKIDASIELIKSGKLKMHEIAYHLRFDSYSSFNKNFKKIMGISPTKYAEDIHHH